MCNNKSNQERVKQATCFDIMGTLNIQGLEASPITCKASVL